MKPKIGNQNLNGPAVDWLHDMKDDNHAPVADELIAVRNFDNFADGFFKRQKEFLKSEN